MEGVVSEFWNNRRVFLTGHTGFKGSWLALGLHRLGARVTGYSLDPPTRPSLFDLAGVGRLVDSRLGDVRDLVALTAALESAKPEVVLHLAAQPLVMGGYSDPVGTYDTNVMGTVNLLHAIRSVGTVRAVVNVTTDKCYANDDRGHAFVESDPLGGVEPYGSSKACSELVTRAMAQSFFDPARHAEHGVAIATARAGNVVGGGDWGENRLLPDMMRAFAAGEQVQIRRPASTRPWQHVLDPLDGYLMLARRLVESGPRYGGGWNFGPGIEGAQPVSWVVERCVRLWGGGASWRQDATTHPAEANLLQLDCSRASALLGWQPRLSLERTLEMTVDWYRQVLANGADAAALCVAQIDEFAGVEIT